MENEKRKVHFKKKNQENITDSDYYSTSSSQSDYNCLYSVISKYFLTEVSSISDVEQVLMSFFSGYSQMRDELSHLQEENQSLKQIILDFEKSDHSQEMELLAKRIKRLKSKKDNLEEQLQTSTIRIEELKSQAKESRLAFDAAERRANLLEAEVNNLKTKLNSTKDVNYVGDSSEQSILVLETLINDQAKEIMVLSEQRESLVQKLKTLDIVAIKADELIRSSQSRINELESYKTDADKSLSIYRTQVNDTAMDVDRIIDDSIRDQINVSGETSPRKFISEAVSILYKSYIESRFRRAPNVQKNLIRESDYQNLLNRTEELVAFMMSSTTGSSASISVPLAVSKEFKSVLISKCNKMVKYIDEARLNYQLKEYPMNRRGMFNVESFDTIDKQLDTFCEFIGKNLELMEQYPIRELFILFSSVCEVNSAIIDRVYSLERATSSTESMKIHNNQVRELHSENAKLKSRLTTDHTQLKLVRAIIKKAFENESIGDLTDQTKLGQALETLAQKKSENDKLNKNIQTLNDLIERMQSDHDEQIVKLNNQFQNETNELKVKMEDVVKKNDTLEKKLKERDDKSSSSIVELLEENKNLSKVVKELEKKLRQNSKSLCNYKEAFNQLKEQDIKMAEDNKQLVLATNELRDTVQKQIQCISELSKSENRSRINKEEIRARFESREIEYQNLVHNLGQKLEELENSKQSQVAALQNKLNISDKRVETLEETLTTVQSQKQALVESISKLRISERALTLKIQTLTEEHEVYKLSAEARENSYQISLKTQAAQQITDLKNQVLEARKLMVGLLKDQFDVQVPEEASFQAILKTFDDRVKLTLFDRNVLTNALQLRRALKLEHDYQLSQVFDEYRSKNDKLTEQLASITDQLKELQSANIKFERENANLIEESTKVIEWENWARSLYYQVTDCPSPVISSRQLKYSLEEAVLSNIDLKTNSRKMEILRAEKNFLKNREIFEYFRSAKESLISIRPLLVAFVFLRRIKCMASCHISCDSSVLSASP